MNSLLKPQTEGISKMKDLANKKEKEIKQPKTESVVQESEDLKHERDTAPTSVIPSVIEQTMKAAERKNKSTPKPVGRPETYEDKRYKAMETAKVSPHVKIMIKSLSDQKFDGISFNDTLLLIAERYIEKELSVDDQTFIRKLIDKEMEDLKTSKKYRKYFLN